MKQQAKTKKLSYIPDHVFRNLILRKSLALNSLLSQSDVLCLKACS